MVEYEVLVELMWLRYFERSFWIQNNANTRRNNEKRKERKDENRQTQTCDTNTETQKMEEWKKRERQEEREGGREVRDRKDGKKGNGTKMNEWIDMVIKTQIVVTCIAQKLQSIPTELTNTNRLTYTVELGYLMLFTCIRILICTWHIHCYDSPLLFVFVFRGWYGWGYPSCARTNGHIRCVHWRTFHLSATPEKPDGKHRTSGELHSPTAARGTHEWGNSRYARYGQLLCWLRDALVGNRQII